MNKMQYIFYIYHLYTWKKLVKLLFNFYCILLKKHACLNWEEGRSTSSFQTFFLMYPLLIFIMGRQER